MSRRPPDDDDPMDPWQELLREVQSALDEQDLGDTVDGGLLNEALVTGLQEAFKQLGELTSAGDTVVRSAEDLLRRAHAERGGPGAESDASEADGPEVTIVEGGRSKDTPPTPGEKPDLRVAPADAAAPEDGDEGHADQLGDDELEGPHGADGPQRPRPRVRVVRLGQAARAATGSARMFPPPGSILLTDPDQLQTVFRGGHARLYRIRAEDGALLIRLDGQPADRLDVGQTIDVEARLIRVRAVGLDGARGSYDRLPTEVPADLGATSPDEDLLR